MVGDVPGVSSRPLAREQDKPKPRRWPVAAPTGHFMAFAPPEVWLRLFAAAGWRVPPRYWLRVAWALLGCVAGFVITLPERLVLAPILRAKFGGDAPTFEHEPGVVIVLGYFRSGTTHLHNLLSCDGRFVTPRWRQCLAPQGFWGAWTLLRTFLIPFLGNSRPHDDVPFGPDWPGEDDFATCNWTLASSLPGRFVTPGARDHWRRFHDLEGLSPGELRRWRFATAAFLWKLSRGKARRPILLKSPSHLARVDELVRLLGADRVRFVHIARDPAAVVRSNVAMHERLESGFAIQDPPPASQTREYLIDEYTRSVERFVTSERSSGARIARVRYADLVNDPLGELERVYGEMEIEWTPRVRGSLVRYLHTVGEYKARHSHAPGEDEDPRLAAARAALDLEREPIERRPLPPLEGAPVAHRRRGWGVLALTALAIVCLWIPLAWLTGNRLDGLVWPTGLAIGLATIRAARVGTTALGIAAAALTLLVYAVVVYPATYLAYSDAWNRPAYDSWIAVRNSVLLTPGNHTFLLVLAVVTAFRCASRKHLRPPGA